MVDDPGTAEISPAIKESSRSTSAVRMIRHRERRRRGLRCVTIAMDEFQIEGLIRRGWLDRVQRADRAAIRKALAFYLHDNLG
jgi:hypothetical protein